MNIAFTKSITTATILCNAILAPAQVTLSKYAFGTNAGSFIYQGDLTPTAIGSFKTPGLAIGLNASRYLTDKFSVRLDLNFGKLKGADSAYKTPEWRQQRNFAFSTPVTEVTGSVVWDAFGGERKLSPYVFIGLGYSFLRINRDYTNFNEEYFAAEPNTISGLEADINHRLPRSLPIIPLGIGVRYRLTNSLSLNTEASYRYISSDYLDGFSRAANSDAKDHYYKFSIGIIYSKSNNGKGGLDCPKF